MSTDALKQLWKAAFGDDDGFIDLFFATAYAPERCRFLEADGQLAAALYWFDCECNGAKYAYLYAVATDPAHRGKGLCRKLMAQTHAHLRSCGYAGVILVPGEPGLFDMYRKMGYRVMGGMDSITCPAGRITAIRQASISEYAAARQTFLPEGGVTQEGEGLAFLAGYAALYTGADFVLAAVREGQALLGLELLGNADAAGGIVAALGCTEGRFRIPGKSRFAMYCPLSDSPAPKYFGLAFD